MSARLLPEVRARDLGVPAHPQARAVVFPAFGAYVGGDITAGLLASGMDRDPRIRLFIDIGTNCEIVLGGRDWLLATAAPAKRRAWSGDTSWYPSRVNQQRTKVARSSGHKGTCWAR